MVKVDRLVDVGIFRAAKSFFRESESQAAKAAVGPKPKIITDSIPPKYRRQLMLFAGPQGRTAIDTIEKYNVKVIFRKGGGSLHDPAKNTIYIDVKHTHPAPQLIHEATHSRWFHEGRQANLFNPSRDDYIKQALDEETDATVQEIEGILELRRNGIKVPGVPLESHYMKGGRDAVSAAFHSGEIPGSYTRTPYPQYYGDSWDAHQAFIATRGI